LWAVDWQVNTYPWDASLLFWRTNLYVWGMRSSPPIQKGTLWNKKVGGDISHTPAVAYDTVYVGTAQGKLLAIQAETGNIKWTTDLDVETTTAPIVAGKTVLIGTRKGVVGLATLTGEVQWHLPTETAIIAAPIVVGDTMYVASRDGTLYAVVSDK
jgi:outer membrane protein assembly factor BamB